MKVSKLFAVIFAIGIMLSACALTRLTERQAFAKAQDIYIEVLEMYGGYQPIIMADNPELNQKIIGYFKKANKILDQWDRYGSISLDDKRQFEDFIQKITMEIAIAIDKGDL